MREIRIRKTDSMFAEVGILMEDGFYPAGKEERVQGHLLFQ